MGISLRLVPAVLLLITGCSDSSASDDGSGGGTSGVTTATGLGASCETPQVHSGEATYYDFADGSGNCGFPATPQDLDVVAINHTDYAGSQSCGACLRVHGPDGSVEVRVVDRCPECPQGDLDLSPQAFAKIAQLEQGRVPISWTVVPCQQASPIEYHFKDGSNPYWTAVQLRNHRHPIARFEVEKSGAFVEVERLDYNYFVDSSGMGDGPYTFRVTDANGQVLVDTGIPLGDNVTRSGAAQFPQCAP